MGSPLASVLSNTFIDFYESNWLNKNNLNEHKFYWWYVDAVLAAFDKEQDSFYFLNFLNKKHPNTKFTIEKHSHFKHIRNKPTHDLS